MTIPTYTRSRSDGYQLTFDAYSGFIHLSQAPIEGDDVTLILSPEDARALADDLRKLLLEIEKQGTQR